MDSVFQNIKNISILSVCIFLIYVLIRIIILILDSKKSIYKVCLEKQKDIEESDFPMFIVREETVYKRIQDELVKIKAEEKTLETAKEIKLPKESGGFLSGISRVLATPERNRFENVNSCFDNILTEYKKSLGYLSDQENYRVEIRKLAIEDMHIISEVIECFSKQIIEYEKKIHSDGSVSVKSSFQGEKWVNSVRQFEPEKVGIGVSMIDLSHSYEGIAGAGLMVAGAVVAIGEMINSKNQKEAQYAEATEKRLDDIDSLLSEMNKVVAYSNQVHEITNSLNQCHEVFKSQISLIFSEIEDLPGMHKKRTKENPYPVVVSEDTLIKLLKIIEVYDSINRIVMEEN